MIYIGYILVLKSLRVFQSHTHPNSLKGNAKIASLELNLHEQFRSNVKY